MNGKSLIEKHIDSRNILVGMAASLTVWTGGRTVFLKKNKENNTSHVLIMV